MDLAGSERIKKTEITGRILQEGLAINLALHYLQQVCPPVRLSRQPRACAQQVIVSLHERAQGKSVHVAYRNHMMTMVLRDSLGGNCMVRAGCFGRRSSALALACANARAPEGPCVKHQTPRARIRAAVVVSSHVHASSGLRGAQTIMIATMSMEEHHLDETVSTARFAQSVAMIKNAARINEEVCAAPLSCRWG